MTKTIPETLIGQPDISYWINSGLSRESQSEIVKIQKFIQSELSDAVVLTQPQMLHISLLNWLSPAVEYGRPKDEIFEEIKNSYDRAVTSALAGEQPIEVNFHKVVAFPKAIIILGRDNGQYQRIRDKWLSQVDLLPGNRKPPDIIHTSIARFVKETELEPIKEFVSKLNVNFTERVSSFRLVKESVYLPNDINVLKTYKI